MLNWFKRSKEKPNKVQSIAVKDVAFVIEQDGDVERSLKARLAERFRRNRSLKEAYLVRVRYGSSPELKVALCLNTGGTIEVELVETAASEFATMFGAHETLDIMYLSAEQQKKISAVAKPFYSTFSHGA